MLKKIILWLRACFIHKHNPIQETIKPSLDKDYIGLLSFALTKDTDIDVSYSLPNVDDLDADKIASIAEQYASFLMAINEGYLRNEIISMIDKNIVKHNNVNEQLFWENVITFWSLLHVEAQSKKQKQKKDQPLIRPLSVFNSSGL